MSTTKADRLTALEQEVADLKRRVHYLETQDKMRGASGMRIGMNNVGIQVRDLSPARPRITGVRRGQKG